MKKRSTLLFFALFLIWNAAGLLAQNIVYFNDPDYIQFGPSGGCSDEGTTLRNTLTTELGYAISNTITDINANFATELAGQSVLVMPENEEGDFVSDLSGANATAINSFVSAGGTFIVISGSLGFGITGNQIINAIFGFSIGISQQTTSGTSSLIPAEATGTCFAGGAATLNNNNGTAFLIPSLPAGAKCIYKNSGTETTVALIPFGAGNIIYLGWDWYFGGPGCPNNDADWNAVLDCAVQTSPTLSTIPTMSQWALFLFGLAVFTVGIVGVYNVRRVVLGDGR